MTWWIWSKYMCLRLHVWWSIPVGGWTTNHQYYHTHTKHMYMNIFTKPSQYSLYYHRVNNSTDNQPVIHTLGNRDHSMDNLYISQHSTLSNRHTITTLAATHFTHTKKIQKWHNRHTHTQDKTRQDHHTHTDTNSTTHYTLYRHSTSTVQVCHTHTGYHGQTHTLHTDANHTPSTHTISSQYRTLIHSLHPRKFHTHALPVYLIILKYPHILPYPPY